MIIMKFGGTSVGNAAQIHKVSQIVTAVLSRQPLVVVSALSGVTNHLLSLIDLAIQKKKVSLAELIQKHKSVIQELKLPDALLDEEIEEVTALFRGISLLEECSPKTKDRILAFGERCSCKIVASYLNSVLSKPTLAIFSYDLGLQTTSQFGQAVPLKESDLTIQTSVSHHKDKLIVTTGFIAKDLERNITTLGRG